MNTHTQILRFLLVGTATVLIDLVTYRTILFAEAPVGPAKAAGFLVGSVFAYFVNRSWTFARHEKSHPLWETAAFIAVYSTALLANIGINSHILAMLGRTEKGILIAFLAATGVSAMLNFLGMKFIAFRTIRV
jgi:putative flippase GtrA